MKLGVVAVVAVALTGRAGAQPAPPAPLPQPPKQPEGAIGPTPAEVAFNEGRALLDAGKHAEACAKFEESIRLDPDAPGTLLNLGLCNERLGKTATALGWFRRAQFRAAETGMTNYEDVAKNSTFSLSVRVPKIRITVTGAPAESPVFVDDRQVPDLELGKVELDPGTHGVELRIAGKPPVHVDITIRDGEEQEVKLAPAAPAPPPPPPQKVYVDIDRGLARRRLAYIIAGAGVALWGGSLAVSLIARDDYNASDHPDRWRSAQQLAGYGGTSLFIAGTAAIAAGVYLWVKAPGVERVERTAVSPAVATDHVGVVVHGAF